MTRIYQLLPAFPGGARGRPWFVDFPTPNIPLTQQIGDGRRFLDWVPRNERGVCPEGEDHAVDYMLALNGWPLFSHRLRTAIEKAFPDAIQFLPFSYGPLSESFNNMSFAIGKLLYLIDAIDRMHTPVDNNDWTPRANGTFRCQYPMHLKAEIAGAYPVFYVVGSPVQIYVRDDLHMLLTGGGFTGVRFDPNVPLH